MQDQEPATPQQKPARRSLFRSKAARPAISAEVAAAPAAAVDAAEPDAQATPKKRRPTLRLAAMALPVLALLGGGGFYGWTVLMAGAPAADAAADVAATIDEANTGHEAPAKDAPAGAHGEAEPSTPPLPVSVAADDSAVAATDYAIVAVYDDEAILATRRSLYRVKVGSRLPGLGDITAVDVVGDGGTVTGSEATLRAVSVTAARPSRPAG